MSRRTYDGQEYTLGAPLDAFAQLALSRKLAPAMPIVDGLLREGNREKDKTLLSVLMLAQLSDEANDFVIKKCLASVSRLQGDKAAKVTAPDGSLMFSDMSMKTMVALTVDVIEENLGDFFRTALADLSAKAAEPS